MNIRDILGDIRDSAPFFVR